jgi:hypothetical protein
MVEHTNVQSICDKNNETNEIQIPHAATRRPFPFEEFFFAFRTTVSVGRPHCRLLRCHHETWPQIRSARSYWLGEPFLGRTIKKDKLSDLSATYDRPGLSYVVFPAKMPKIHDLLRETRRQPGRLYVRY